jgi:hypothetical protein
MTTDLIEYLKEPIPQGVIWLTILVMISTIGFYVVQRFRGQSGEDSLTTHELLTNFREMNQEGDIDDGEFRTIKTVLAPHLIPSDERSLEESRTPAAEKPKENGTNDENASNASIVSDSNADNSASSPTASEPESSDPTTADHKNDEGEDTAKNTGNND